MKKNKTPSSKSSKNFYQTVESKIKKFKRENLKDNSFDIGKTVRALRIEQGIRAIDFCTRAGGLDPKTLNALEMGRIRNPTIKTLQAVARGFGITVGDLFREVEFTTNEFFYKGTQRGAYQVLFPAEGVKIVSFTPFVENIFCGKLILGAKKRISENLLKHPSPLYISPLVGRFEIQIDKKKHSLKVGENIFFHGNVPHSFYNPLRRESVLMMITAPSIFK